ncbi:hypothetical protein D3C77_139900 [compost metagenome]
MINKIYLDHRQFVTVDDAALMVAGIDPVKAHNCVYRACYMGTHGGALAEKIRGVLINNLCKGHLDPEPASIEYHPIPSLIGDPYDKYKGIADIAAALKERGAPINATFKADSLWRWIANNLAQEEGVNPELFAYLVERYLQDSSPKVEHTGLPLPYDIKSSARERDLAEQVAALSKRVQQVEEENAELRAKTPTIRHLTQMITLVLLVQERYWGDNWDRDIPDSYPKQNDIIEWLMGAPHCCTKRRAIAIEIIACAAHRRGKL